MKKVILLSWLLLLAAGVNAQEAKMKNALLVYGSFAGTTKAVAEAIQATLAAEKYRVEILPAQGQAMDFAQYDLVVIGSAIRGATPHPDVLAFVEKNRERLRAKTTAVFIVCITITSSKPGLRAKAEHYPEKVAIGFTPASTAIFGGVAQDAGWFGNWMGKVILGIKLGDFRDWDKIKAWARSLAALGNQ